jgi:hypothetical protein
MAERDMFCLTVIVTGCKDTSSSTLGCVMLMNGGMVAYYSGRQIRIALWKLESKGRNSCVG